MLNLIEKRQTNEITFQAEIQNAALWQSSHLIYRPQDDASALQVFQECFLGVHEFRYPEYLMSIRGQIRASAQLHLQTQLRAGRSSSRTTEL